MKLRWLYKTLSNSGHKTSAISGLKTSASRWLSGMAAKIKEAARDDAGVALVALVFVIGGAALATTAMLVLDEQGIPAELRATKSQQAAIEKIEDALEVYILRNNSVPCPADGTLDDGMSVASCDDGNNDENAGVVPWVTIGLGKEDAIDGFGNVFTYVAATNLAENGVDTICESIGGDISGDVIAGNINIDTDNDMVDSADITDAIYAVIGHGSNRIGGYNSRGIYSGTPSSSLEDNNAIAGGAGSLVLLNDFPSNTQGAANTIFDDEVIYKEPRDLRDICESIVEQGDVNNLLFVDFEGSTDLADNFTPFSPGGTAPAQTNFEGDGVAVLTADSSLDTNLQFSVDLAPTYVSMDWTPTAGTEGGLSLITRSGGGNPNVAPDTYSNGITFRFWQDSLANNIGQNNTISIDCTADCGGGTSSGADVIDIQLNQAYTVELYDDGEKVWARMYEIDDPTNQASVFIPGSGVTEDVNNFPNRLTILNVDEAGGLTSRIDDVLVARAMGAVAFGGGALNPASVDFDGTDADVDVQFSNMTLEAWIKPTAALGSNDTFVSKSDPGELNDTHQSFLLAMNSAGTAVEFFHTNQPGLGATSTNSCTSNIDPTVGEWTHIAVTFESGFVRMYQDGELVTTCTGLTNINRSSLAAVPFRIGAGTVNGVVTNGFAGEIAEVRLWSTTRSATEIEDNYRRRVLSTEANLNLYWRLDVDDTNGGSTLFAGDEATCITPASCVGDFGSLANGAEFIGAPDEFRLPFADDVCVGEEDSLFSCLYDVADSGETTSAIPVNLTNITVKMWGGGGASSDDYANPSYNSGGAGGFGSARFASVNGGATTIPGSILTITVGAGGTAQTGDSGGGGGGGSSLVVGAVTAMQVGGGGGAGTGSENDFDGNAGGNNDCDEYSGTDLRCGAGAGGGGAGLAGNDAANGGPATANACAGNGGGAGAGADGTGGDDGACSEATQESASAGNGGGDAGGAGGGAGAGNGGNNNGEAGGGGGGASGGGAGNHGVAAGNLGFGGGGGSGLLDGDAESSRAETGEDGGASTFSGAGATERRTALPGGGGANGAAEDPDWSGRTYATCAATGSTGTPGQGGPSLNAAGNGENGCDGAVLLQW